MKLAHAARTDVGMIRSGNEDNFAVDANGSRGVFIVADGMGGHAAGEIASRMVIDIVRRAVEDGETSWPADASIGGPDSGPRRFITGIHRANRRIHQLAQKDRRKRGMGTTFAGVFLLARSAVLAHVGDSRIYRMRDGELTLLTKDHSLTNEMLDMGFLQPDQVATFSRRNVITRAVGTHDNVDVDTKIVDVRPGDTLILCSDGLHGEVSDDEIADIVSDLGDPMAVVDLLIARANDKGGPDNVTAVVVRLGDKR